MRRAALSGLSLVGALAAASVLATPAARVGTQAVTEPATTVTPPAVPDRSVQWPTWGNDPGGTRYSPLAQIHRGNVKHLKPAWTFDLGELALGRGTGKSKAGFVATPIVVDGVLYVSSPSSRVFALDAETGRRLWVFDPQGGRSPRLFNSHRGVAYWEGPAASGAGRDRRIFSGTVDGRLIALDAATGKLVTSFGAGGSVDLRAGVADGPLKEPSWGPRVTSPPVVWRDLLITGWGLPETPGRGPSGDVRAFDVRSGREAWRFHTVPRPGEAGHETWDGDSWKDRGGTNVWSMMSVDVERGLVFLPVGSPTYDFWGGDRKGQNLFGNSLVALEAATGRRVWHFQTVHHDLWDYDLPAQPVLVTVKRDGRDVPAVAQVAKTGFVFVLDRVTGEPLFPVEERTVPGSEVPGETTWPTQPFPVNPAPLARLTMTREELSRVTPEAEAGCRALFEGLLNRGPFTPAGLARTLNFPGYLGGANWGGASFDPTSGRLYVSVNEEGSIGQMRPGDANAALPYYRAGGREAEGEYPRFRGPNGWPCQKPPWGTLNAVDLGSGDRAWRVPLGEVEVLSRRGVPKTGTQSLGGSIVTAGGLVFIGATVDKRIRAFDAATGDELWSHAVPANAHATPATYAGRGGRQFVVIAAGGGGMLRELSADLSDSLIAFALP
jgi:membrane-bound PQQ-dependent dehydrogenase (glucose/quinate/shikimate family)